MALQRRQSVGNWIHNNITNKWDPWDGGIKFADSPNIDAFNRIRISSPYTLFDSKFLHDAAPLVWDDKELSGCSTSTTHDPTKATNTLTVAASTAGARARQTFMRFNYQSGKSQLSLYSAIFPSAAEITGRVGSFTACDGVFFENACGTMGVVIRSSTSGSVIDTRVDQDDWNIEGASEFDWTKAHIFTIDYEWLGLGRVRFGVIKDGLTKYVHQEVHTNKLDTVYMRTPNLPVRYEIENDGGGVESNIAHLCSTVMSEGGVEENGILRYDSTIPTHVDANTSGTTYAIIGIRLKATHLDSAIRLVKASIMCITNDNYEWTLRLNPTVAGTFAYSDITNSAIQSAKGATGNTVTGGTTITGEVIKSGNNSGATKDDLKNALSLGASIDNTVDEFVLCATPLGSNADIHGSLEWRELL